MLSMNRKWMHKYLWSSYCVLGPCFGRGVQSEVSWCPWLRGTSRQSPTEIPAFLTLSSSPPWCSWYTLGLWEIRCLSAFPEKGSRTLLTSPRCSKERSITSLHFFFQYLPNGGRKSITGDFPADTKGLQKPAFQEKMNLLLYIFSGVLFHCVYWKEFSGREGERKQMVPNERGESQILSFPVSEQLRCQQQNEWGMCCGFCPPSVRCQALGYVNRALISQDEGGHSGSAWPALPPPPPNL